MGAALFCPAPLCLPVCLLFRAVHTHAGSYRDSHIRLEGPAVDDLLRVCLDSLTEAGLSQEELAFLHLRTGT